MTYEPLHHVEPSLVVPHSVISFGGFLVAPL